MNAQTGDTLGWNTTTPVAHTPSMVKHIPIPCLALTSATTPYLLLVEAVAVLVVEAVQLALTHLAMVEAAVAQALTSSTTSPSTRLRTQFVCKSVCSSTSKW